jgi:uncharacterized membrane protein
MAILILGLVIFFAVHCVRIVAPGLRSSQLAANEGRWKGLYSLASLVGFALIVWGWISYRPVAPDVYIPPDWGRHVTIVLVLLAFIALPTAYQPPGRIRTWLRHPFLTAVILWSLGHLFANGDLASVLLFGSFLAYGIVDRIAVAFRPDPPPVYAGPRGDIVGLVVGLILFAVFVFGLHAVLFGVSPIA